MKTHYFNQCAVFMVTFVFAFMASTYPLQALAQYKTYVVNPHETLSEILYAQNLKPIYGKKGNLVAVLKLNPAVQPSQGNLIFVGQKILLPIPLRSLSNETESSDMKTVLSPEKIDPTSSTPVIIENVKEEDVAQAQALVGLGVDFFRIDGEDSLTASPSMILSNASPTLNLGFDLEWNKQNTISFMGEVQHYSLQKLNNNRTYVKDNGTRVGVGVMLNHKLNPDWSIGIGSSFEQELFFRASSTTEISVDSVLVIKPTISTRYDFLTKKNASIGLDADYAYALPATTDSYKVNTGTHAGLGFHAVYKSKPEAQREYLEGRVGYSVDTQDTSVTTRSDKNLYFKVLYSWELNW